MTEPSKAAAMDRLREILDAWPDDRPIVEVDHLIECHPEDAPRPEGDGTYVVGAMAPEHRERVTFEFTSGPRRVTYWRKLSEEEEEELAMWDECDD